MWITRLITKRLLLGIPTLLGVSILVFAIARLAPGDPGVSAADFSHLRPEEQVAFFQQQRALAQKSESPITEYFAWLRRLVTTPDGHRFSLTLGYSPTTGRAVTDELARRLPVTLLLNGLAAILMYAIAIPLGAWIAATRHRALAHAVDTVLLAAWSVPMVLAAALLIAFTSHGGVGLQWFPNHGLTDPALGTAGAFRRWLDIASHLVLPVFCLTYVGAAYLTRHMRASVAEQMHQPYVTTALARGLSLAAVVRRHVLRNSILPVITLAAGILPMLIGGSVIVEGVFGIEGMGRFALRAMQNREIDVILALALLAAAMNILGLLLADIAYVFIDRRVRLH